MDVADDAHVQLESSEEEPATRTPVEQDSSPVQLESAKHTPVEQDSSPV